MKTQKLTPKGTLTRQRILDATRQTLIHEGLEAVAMRAIADRCNITLGNLQYYFATREALLTTVITLEAQRDLDVIEHTNNCESEEEALRQITNNLLDRWQGDSAAIFTALNLLAQHHDTYRTLYHQIYLRFYSTLEEAISCVRPTLAKADIKRRARLLSALIDGGAMQPGMGKGTTLRKHLLSEATRIALA